MHALFQQKFPALVLTRNRHALPEMRRMAEEFGIRFLRRPADLDAPYRAPLQAKLVNLLVRDRARAMDLSPFRVTNHFAGFTITGRYNAADLQALFARLPEGVTELMTHPGFADDALPGRHAWRANEVSHLTHAATLECI